MTLVHIVTPEEAGLTLHQMLRGPLALSGRQTRQAKQQGAVTVDAAPFFANQRVQTGMVIRVELQDFDTQTQHTPTNLPPIDILFEDEALIAVHKPALLQCHPSPSAPGGSDTLEARVSAHLGRSAHPVHRLDAETTGIVLFAKLPYAQAHLQQQMQLNQVFKTYEAWVFGVPSSLSGKIDAPIARLSPDSFTRVVREDGQHAVSSYHVLDRIASPEGEVTSVKLHPLTGRTHQLRVHMTHIGCPLLGDSRYFTEASKAASDVLGLHHHQLAATELSFIHPVTAERTTIASPAQFAFMPNRP